MSQRIREKWIAKLDGDGDGSWEVIAKSDLGLTVLVAYGLTKDAADLIAAAPEMLQTLKDVLNSIEWRSTQPGQINGVKTLVERAIAMATGVPDPSALRKLQTEPK